MALTGERSNLWYASAQTTLEPPIPNKKVKLELSIILEACSISLKERILKVLFND